MRSPVVARLRKALSLLCAALLCCSLIPTTALASQDSLSLIPEGGQGAVSIPSGAEGGGPGVLALRSEAAPSVDGGGAVTSSEDVPDTKDDPVSVVDDDVRPSAEPLASSDAPPPSDADAGEDVPEAAVASDATALENASAPRYSVLFDMNGGDPYPALDGFGFKAAYGELLPDISGIPAASGRPSRSGFVFTGFYDGSDYACANKYYTSDLTVDATCEGASAGYPYRADCLRLFAGWAPVIDVTVPASLAVAVGTSVDVDAPVVVSSGNAVENRTTWKLRCDEIAWDASEVSEGEVPLLAFEESLAAELERKGLSEIFSETDEVRLSMSAGDGGGKVSPGGRASLLDSPIEVAAASSVELSYGIEVGADTEIEGEKWSRTRLLMPFEAVFDPAPDARASILFDANGGEGGQTLSLVGVCGEPLPALSEGVAPPVLEGHDFLGYFDDPSDFSADRMLYAADMSPVAGRTWEGRTAKVLYAGWRAKECGVVLDAGEGAVVDIDAGRTKRYSLPYGTVLGEAFPNGLPEPVSLGGYAFAGWFRADGEVPDMGMRLTDHANDLVLYARFDGEPVTVVWDACGDADDPAEVDPASWEIASGHALGDAGELPVPVRPGYDFQGWFSRPQGQGVQADAATVVRADAVYYAHWSPSLIALSWTLDANEVYEQRLRYGSTVVLPEGLSATPAKPGRSFDGWYVADASGSPSGDSVEFAPSTPVPRQDTAWIAAWTVLEYEVAFDLDGGEGEVSSVTARYGEDLPCPTVYRASRDGYALEGWYDARGDGGVKYVNADGTPCRAWDKEEDTVLYARWTANRVVITWHPQNGGPATQMTQTWSPDAMLEFPPDPVRDGYEFLGWYTGSGSNQGSRLENPCRLPLKSGTVSLFAHWTDDPVTLLFDVNGGTGATPGSQVIVYGESCALPNCAIERDGYTFDGWAETPSGGKAFEIGGSFDSATVAPGTIKTFYAHWSSKSVTLMFNLNGGMGDAPLSWDKAYNQGSWGLPSCSATRVGYTFDGWADTPSGERRYAPGDLWYPSSYPYAATMYLYAHWSPNIYTIKWSDMYDSGLMYAEDSYAYDPSTLIAFPANPTRFGYVFAGWRTGPGLSNGSEVCPPMKLLPQNLTLYAVWRPIKLRFVWMLNYENAPLIPETLVSFSEEARVPFPSMPTRPGYRFKEWRTGAGPTLGRPFDDSWTLKMCLETWPSSGEAEITFSLCHMGTRLRRSMKMK